MKERVQRWSSARSFQLVCAEGRFTATIVNVSETGAFAEGALPLAVGESVSLAASGEPIRAKVARVNTRGAALTFEAALTPSQIDDLRSFRDLGHL